MNIESFFPFFKEKMYGSHASSVVRLIQQGWYGGVKITCNGGQTDEFPEESAALIDQRFPTLAGMTVGSLAVHFFLCGEFRLATPDSQFAIHHTRIIAPDGTEETLEDLIWQREINDTLLTSGQAHLVDKKADRFLRDKILMLADHHHFAVRWYARRTGLAPGILDQMMRNETILTASEALQLGFVHRIIEA